MPLRRGTVKGDAPPVSSPPRAARRAKTANRPNARTSDCPEIGACAPFSGRPTNRDRRSVRPDLTRRARRSPSADWIEPDSSPPRVSRKQCSASSKGFTGERRGGLQDVAIAGPREPRPIEHVPCSPPRRRSTRVEATRAERYTLRRRKRAEVLLPGGAPGGARDPRLGRRHAAGPRRP